jgi:multiple sugar transport system substrate-binding protein
MSRFLKVAAAATAAVLALAPSGGNDDKYTGGSTGSASGSESDVTAALAKGGNLTVWAWDQTIKDVAAGFE